MHMGIPRVTQTSLGKVGLRRKNNSLSKKLRLVRLTCVFFDRFACNSSLSGHRRFEYRLIRHIFCYQSVAQSAELGLTN